MRISKKKYRKMKKRIADLEVQVQRQQEEIQKHRAHETRAYKLTHQPIQQFILPEVITIKNRRMEEKLKKIEKVCEPVVDYLKKNHDPHTYAVISQDSIKILKTEIGIPVNNNNQGETTMKISDEELQIMAKTAMKAHKSACESWPYGKIKDFWLHADNTVGIKYKNGSWFHYYISSNGQVTWW